MRQDLDLVPFFIRVLVPLRFSVEPLQPITPSYQLTNVNLLGW
jgi:hypothetical protein